MGVLHVKKVKYWRIFCDVISLLAQVYILSSNRVSKEVSMKKKILWLSLCDMTTFKKQDTVPWPLTYEGQYWIEYNHISILYKFQIDISSNSREIKYQILAGHTDTHTHTHTQTDRVKTIPRNPLQGRGKNASKSYVHTDIKHMCETHN